jgi:hypothetical protein
VWSELSKQGVNAFPGGFDYTFTRFPQQCLGFGKDLFDRIQVRAVSRQEQEFCVCFPDGLSHRIGRVAAEIVEHDDIAGLQRWYEKPLDMGKKTRPIDRATQHGRRSMQLSHRAARKVSVFQWPYGPLARSRSSLRQRPRVRVILVLAHGSSIKTKRFGSRRPWQRFQPARLRLTSCLSCSQGSTLFLKLIPSA